MADEGAETSAVMRVNLKFIDEVAIGMTVERGIRIDALKAQICEVKGTAAATQRLIYKGKVLRDNMHLHDYNFKDGDTVHVVVTPPRPITSTTLATPTNSVPDPTASNATEDAQPGTSLVVVPSAPVDMLAMEESAPISTIVWSRPGIRRLPRHRIEELLVQATGLRQAAERLSEATTSLSHSPLASSLSAFSNALLVLARQVSMLVQTIEAGRGVGDDSALTQSITDAVDLLRQLETIAPSVRDVLSTALAPPEDATTTISLIQLVPSSAGGSTQGNISGINIMMALLQALGNTLRGSAQPNSVANAPRVSDAAITPTITVGPSQVQPQPEPSPSFSDARTPMLGADTPLSALLDLVGVIYVDLVRHRRDSWL
ncbi:hypothetical protein DYB32_003821 [Aphanomyces invadans]|uniref:Ubiquitin-like domain-containing protein n=1 Tax=Aphanomyces invadans TaxID=157072 RepID=A0A418AZM0_9STRA|nr:hypothetical protein DYB32_003821 [Aphanomyces invadans]